MCMYMYRKLSVRIQSIYSIPTVYKVLNKFIVIDVHGMEGNLIIHVNYIMHICRGTYLLY